MQCERDLQGFRGDGSDVLVSEFAIELLKQDVRPTAIIRDLRPLYGTGRALDEGVIFENAAFSTMIRKQSAIWSEKTLSRILDIGCPGEVQLAAPEVRFRVMDLGCEKRVRGVVVMDYSSPPTNRSNEGRNPTGDIFSDEKINGISERPNPNTTAAIEPTTADDEEDDSSPYQWVPQSYSHHMATYKYPPTTPTPPNKQYQLVASRIRSASPTLGTSITTTRQTRQQYRPIMPNWEAAAEYFERIGRGGRWIPGSTVGEETEEEWEADSRRKEEERPLLDWTHPDFVPLPQYSATHYDHLRAIDWSKTNLGPRETWDAALLTMVTSIMTTAYPTAVYWGPEYTILYNEHFVAIAQNRSPYILGKSFATGWPELASYFIPILDKAYYHGEATIKQEELLHIVGRVPDVEQEESYFNFIMCPVTGKDGRTVGVLEQALEVTREVISNRRMVFVRYLGEILAGVDFSVSGEFLKKVLQAFKTTPDNGVWNDTPFMGLYGLDDPEVGRCTLVGSIGLPKYLAPDSCDLFSHTSTDTTNEIFVEAMREAMGTGESVLIELGKELSKDIETRAKGKLCRFAILIPIQAAKGLIRGFLILGINPQRPFDDDYRFWVGLLKTELSSTAGREELLKAEIRKGIDAEIQRNERARIVEVQNMLDTRTKELRESELLFTKTAETIPVGLALISLSGDLLFTNTAYHELSTLPRETDNPTNLTWRDIIYPEDRERVYRIFDEAVSKAVSAQWESRTGTDYLERGWKHWVSCNMVVQTNEQTGELTGYLLTLSDITQVKLAEEYQRQISAQAVEKRRQQENFIDIFSHELRNPFSATLQCADGILAAVTEYQLRGGHLDVDDIADASSTILVCVQHQMRIINDVLTLSKLDSMLLSVVPTDVQIHESILTTLKIFQSELQVKGIKAKFIIGDSYERLKLDWLKCDPSRFNQILVNLLTNAIKFTSFQSERCEITVILDAYTERPKRNGKVIYACPKGNQERSEGDGEEDTDDISKVQGEEWGTGEPVYVHVEVQDTGIGISEHWQKKLFNRFEQVPKTHVTYGGSGLGLFICRKLCRLQGGRIGVTSKEGKGSKFSFYITARRTNPPPGVPSSRPNKVQIISDASAHGPSSPGLPWGGLLGQPVPSQPVNSFNNRSGIPEHIIATFIPEHISTPRLAAVRRIQSAMAAQSLKPSAAITSPMPPSPEPAPQTEFVPHTCTSSAMQSTLKAFKPLRSPSIQPQSSISHSGYKVLIVEDNLINQEVLRRQLRKEGCIAHVANNGQEGLEFVERSEFGGEGGIELDIVLMDMEMPVMDGNTATKKIRQMEAEGKLTRHVPILGISANARSEQVAQMIRAGMDDAISKPFRIVDLVAKFDPLIENSRNNLTKVVDEKPPTPQSDTNNRIIKQSTPFEMSSLASILSSTTPLKSPFSNEAVSPSYTLSPMVPLPPSGLGHCGAAGSSSPEIVEVPSPTVLPSPMQAYVSEPATTQPFSPVLSPLSQYQSRAQSNFIRADSMPLPYTRQNQDAFEVPFKPPRRSRSQSQSHSQSQRQHQHQLSPSSVLHSPPPSALSPSQSTHNMPQHSSYH